MKTYRYLALLAGPLLLGSTAALGVTTFSATLLPSNGSGASGTAEFTLGTDTLSVSLQAKGLAPNQHHPMHIHGFVNGPASRTPALGDDLDRDGFLEGPEAETAVGGGILSIVTLPQAVPAEASDPNLYPVAAADGSLNFAQTYTFNLSDPAQALAWQQLQALDTRWVEIHGIFVPNGPGSGTPWEINGIGGYKDMLPVAGGPIVSGSGGLPTVPEPASAGLLGLGLAALLVRPVKKRAR